MSSVDASPLKMASPPSAGFPCATGAQYSSPLQYGLLPVKQAIDMFSSVD